MSGWRPARCLLLCDPPSGQAKVVLSHEELALLLGGIDLAETRRRRWYRTLSQGEQTLA